MHTAALVSAFFFLVSAPAISVETAYSDAVNQVKESFHWDHMDGGFPAVATNARVNLAEMPTDLLTINYDAGQSSLYRSFTLQGTNYDCVLVSTFTRKTGIWLTAQTNQPLQLHNPSPSYDLFTWVTVGSSLKDYIGSNYGSTLTTNNVDRRLSQALGMEDRTGQNRGLAFYWVPTNMILRPAYSADVSTQISWQTLPTYPDSSFGVVDASAGGASFQFMDYNNTSYIGTNAFGDFVMNNQAKTEMPWSAMGYTYNWNYLEDGLNGRSNDPTRVTNYVGASEFVVSAGAWVQFEGFVENDQLYTYLVPEPGTGALLLVGLTAVWMVHRRRKS